MSDLDPAFDSVDPVDFISANRRRVVGEAMSALPDDPQKAARAYQLGRATGGSPALISTDLDNYELQHRSALTSTILTNNSWLRQYLDNDPMRAQLSSDDWGNLDGLTSSLEGFRKFSGFWTRPEGPFDAAWKGFQKGVGEGPIGEWVMDVPILKDKRMAQAMSAAGWTPVEVFFRGLSGGIHGATEFARQLTEDLTGSPQLARDAAGMVENQLTGVGVHGAGVNKFPSGREQREAKVFNETQAAEAIARAKAWIDSGEEPPPGIHPAIDRLKEKQNDRDVKKLEEQTKAAESSATRERDPQSIAELVGLRDRGSIEIDGEAVLRLYGDKPPGVEDGLLGWAPRLAEQLELARATGTDISIPLRDWLAYADGEMMKLLRDDIRVRPGGITKNEARAARGEDVNALRDQAAADMAAAAEEAIAEGSAGGKEQGRAAVGGEGAGAEAKPDPAVEEFLKARRSREIIPDDLPSARAAGGFEPLFAIGDRKISLKKAGESQSYTGDTKFHDFNLLDEHGNDVGTINLSEQKGGKELYIEMIQAGPKSKGFYDPNFLGPSLIRDVLRQIKQAFPEAESLTGHRVSGAREKAKSWEEAHAMPKIKLDEIPQGWGEISADFRELLRGVWEKKGGIEIFRGELTLEQQALSAAVEKAIRQMAPAMLGKVETTPLDLHRGEGRTAGGTYMRFRNDLPTIIVSLEGTHDAVGIGRHEGIHHLRKYGFFDEGEWLTLERAARENGWLEKHGIGTERYQKLDMASKLEEAIAEEYRTWRGGKDTAPKAQAIFEKLKEFFEAIRTAFKELTGKELSWEEVFRKIDEGEIGSREGRRPLEEVEGRPYEPKALLSENANTDMAKHALETARGRDNEVDILNARGRSIVYDRGLARKAGIDVNTEEYAGTRNALGKLRERIRELGFEPKFSEREPELPQAGTTRIEDRPLFKTPGAIGITAAHNRAYAKAVREMHEADVAYSQGKAEKEQKRRLTAEYRQEKKIVESEVEADFDRRPDVAADIYFARGELYGEKTERMKIDPEDLKAYGIDPAGLPKDYLARPDGVKVELDDFASLLGYPTGRAMVEDLVRYNAAKLTANMSAKAFRNRLMEQEVERRMSQRVGNLEENIRDAVLDQVTSETSLNMIAEDTLALGILHNREASLNKAEIRDWLKERFEDQPMRGESADKYLRASGKLGTQVEIAVLKGEIDKAYRDKQAQYYAATTMKLARELEKEQKKFEKLAKRLSKRDVSGLDIDYQDQVQALLWQAGVPTRRSMLDIQRSQAARGKGSLADFVAEQRADGYVLDIDPEILAGRVKPLEDMTVGEFRDFHEAIRSLNAIGRVVEKINVEGAARDFAAYRDEVVRNIQTLPYRPREAQEKGLAHRIFQADAELTRTEVILKDLDLGEEMGPLVNAIIRPMAEAKHEEYTMQEKLSKDIKALKTTPEWQRSMSEVLRNDWFLDPVTGEPFKLTRSNLINLALNWGNKGNREKIARAYGSSRPGVQGTRAEAQAFKDKMETYFEQHMRKEDWDFVQGIWDIYKGFQGGMERVWQATSGTQPRLVEALPIQTPHGTYEGGYYPLIRDWHLSGLPEVKDSALFGPNYPNYSTPQNYTKDRTGATYFVDFRSPISQIPTRMQQVIHDIAYREAVMNAKKIITDKQINNAIVQHYGHEYADQLKPWLERVAHGGTVNEAQLNWANTILRKTRMNLTYYALPFNYVVTLTPDLGAPSFRSMANYWPNREANIALAEKWSKEIPHAIYNMDRDFREAMQKAVGEGRVDTARIKAVQWGYSIVSGISREFRRATWIDKFNTALAEGKDEAKAAAIADSYVRERHSSAAIQDLPPIMAAGEAGRLLTIMYGYWNTMYNWQRTIPGHIRRGDHMEALSAAYGTLIIGSIMGAFIANPAKEDESWLKRFAKAPVYQMAGMIPFLREFGTFMFEGIPPNTPLGSTIKAIGATTHDMVKYARKQPVEKGIRHTLATAGLAFGVPGTLQAGRTLQGLYDYSQGRQRPRDIFEWTRLLATGEARLKRTGER